MIALSPVAWFVIFLVALPLAYAVVAGLYRSKMRKRRLIADFPASRPRLRWAPQRFRLNSSLGCGGPQAAPMRCSLSRMAASSNGLTT